MDTGGDRNAVSETVVVVGEGVGLKGKKLKLKQIMLGKDANQLRGNYIQASKKVT